MELSVVEDTGVRFVEGHDGESFMSTANDASRVIEACFAARTTSALLYSQNLTDRFFDVSSGEAGAIVQKLRTYRVRLAVVCSPGSVRFSHRFGEFVAAERRDRYFAVFETRAAARDWLVEDAGS